MPSSLYNVLYYRDMSSSQVQLGVVIHPLQFPSLTSEQSTSGDLSYLILPHVILWNPLIQFESLITIVCPEGGCNLQLQTNYWKYGQNKGSHPRIVHDLDYTVVLVSAVWCCDKGHNISSMDPRIVQHLVERTGFQPFILFHKKGFHHDLSQHHSWANAGGKFLQRYRTHRQEEEASVYYLNSSSSEEVVSKWARNRYS